jgi:two-component system, OmpR family, sensor histidine kinase VicK
MVYPSNPTLEDIEQKTEIIYGEQNIINDTVERLSAAKERVDACMDSIAPSTFVIPNHPITQVFRDTKKRGIPLRFIAEITKQNIEHCKELMKISELRHLDEVKGNFGIVDGIYYRAIAKAGESSAPPLLIASTISAFVEQQQYFFEMLWRKAIPAKQRIKEIEEGVKREFIETIQDPTETQTLTSKIITSCIGEIDIVFSTPNSFKRYEREGTIDLLARKIGEGIKVRILLNQNDHVRQSVKRLVKTYPQISIRELDKSIKTKLTTIMADRELSMVIELKDDTKENNNEAMGLATYSNSESTVLSYASIFETLWIQSTEITI